MTTASCWALVPVKQFSLAKSRLSPVLLPDERAELARAMLGDVLEVLASAGLAGIAVVSADGSVRSFARLWGATALAEGDEPGLNGAVATGRAALRDRASTLLIVPSDLPMLCPATIRSACNLVSGRRMACIAPAARDGGTNLLAFPSDAEFAPAFGERSFRKHRRRFERTGLHSMVLEGEDVGLDLDRPEDLYDFRLRGLANRTGRVLAALHPPTSPPRSSEAANGAPQPEDRGFPPWPIQSRF